VDLPGITAMAPARLGAWQPGDAWLAGGTWLFSEPQPSLSRLLDLQAFGWTALRAGPDGLEIAATCTLAELARLRAQQWPAAPLIGQCCGALLGSFKVWNMATVGGNLCLALPAGPMISLTAALDGHCEIWAPDGRVRHVPAAEFVTGAGCTVLRSGELLRSVRLPAAALAGTTAFRQFSLSPLGRSAALVIGRRDGDGSLVITVTASTTRPVQLRFEAVPEPDDLRAALAAAQPPWHDDVHGLPAWREAVTGQLALAIRDELHRAVQNRAVQNRAEQNRAEQNRDELGHDERAP
jgi:CO/xanthine dehydrogenase FAD-binding subunit